MDPDSSRLLVTVTDGRGRRVADGGLARWLSRVAPPRLRGEVAVALVSDAHIRKLNRQHRGKDAVTDVLSFPAEDFRLKPEATYSKAPDGVASAEDFRLKPEATYSKAPDGVASAEDFRLKPEATYSKAPDGVASAFRRKSAEPRFFGDIVIATGAARRQARQAGHVYATELRVLALHGLLHLLGYDHDDRGDHGRMARAEARLRRAGGLKAGLIARTGAPPQKRPRPARR